MNLTSKHNKIMSIIFISSCSFFISLLFLLEVDFSTNVNFTLHELFSICINFFVFFIPVEALVWIFILIKYGKNKDKKPILNLLLNLISIVIFFTCIVIYIFFINSVTASIYSNNIQKYTTNQRYYINHENKIIEITKTQYNLIDSGKWYHFEYKYNKLIPNKYSMTIFEEDL